MSSSSQGDTGNVRKSVGFMNTGEAERRLDALMREKQHLKVPDNANAIACVAASSLADIGTTTVGKKGATNEHVQSPSSVRSNAQDDDVVSHDFALAQNTGPKERQGQSKAKRGATKEHDQKPNTVHSNAHDDGVVGHDIPLAQNAAPKERQGLSRSPGCDD